MVPTSSMWILTSSFWYLVQSTGVPCYVQVSHNFSRLFDFNKNKCQSVIMYSALCNSCSYLGRLDCDKASKPNGYLVIYKPYQTQLSTLPSSTTTRQIIPVITWPCSLTVDISSKKNGVDSVQGGMDSPTVKSIRWFISIFVILVYVDKHITVSLQDDKRLGCTVSNF